MNLLPKPCHVSAFDWVSLLERVTWRVVIGGEPAVMQMVRSRLTRVAARLVDMMQLLQGMRQLLTRQEGLANGRLPRGVEWSGSNLLEYADQLLRDTWTSNKKPMNDGVTRGLQQCKIAQNAHISSRIFRLSDHRV
ncbi:hypothetical protein Scep_015486 [Stephania cephalantha]|uniref:Uncharacterized protein n=1 Tax=Stephania cephalantha TaxID=152367 RepID=A0AAP0P2V2_9MAGN